ncbi:MAG TPA: ABC transporter substrate-binding protein [Egibacteraceae bacterium]|nr:ABC transporter substrate-binding protein [Egibacteraceae bacterium]
MTVGCGDGNGQTRFTPERPGTLTVATNLPAPGWWNGESAAALTGGFEYGMASEIARRLGLTGGVLVINVPFDDLVAGHVGKYDIGLSQVTITPERAKVVDFSAPYFNSHAGVLVSKGTAVPDLSAAKRLRWGVMAATTMETFLDEQVKPDVPVRLYPDQSQTVAALRNGEVDALLLDTFSALVEATQSAGTFEVPAQFRTGESFGAVLPKGSKNRPEVDRVIKALADDGTLGRLSDQFLEPQFGTDPAGIRFIEVPLR